MPVGNRGALFQRRHYNAIAEVIRDLGCVTEFQRRNVADEFARRIAGTNSAFNRDRFIAAATDTGRTDREPYVPAQVSTEPNTAAQVSTPTQLCADGCNREATRLHSRSDGVPQLFCQEHACSSCDPIDSLF